MEQSIENSEAPVAINRAQWWLSGILAPLLAAVICLLAAVLALASLGYAPGEVLKVVWSKVLWRADLHRRLISWANILQYATPLLLCGLAVTVAFRASVWNIGGQGQYLVGALAANAIGAFIGVPYLSVGLLVATSMLAGAVLAAVAGLLEISRRVPVVLSTLLLNAIATELLRWCITGPLHDPGLLPTSRKLLEGARLHTFGDTTLHTGFFIALATAAGVAFVLRKTTFGFRLRVVGENPIAARFAGMSVSRVMLATLALSGALAGLAGGIEISGVRHELAFDDADSGYGFTGIAVALLGRLSPAGVVAAAIFFGALKASFLALEAEARVPSVTGLAVQGMVVILMLIMTNPYTAQIIRRLLFASSKQSAGL